MGWGLRIDETGVTYVSISFSSPWMKFQRKSRNWHGKGKHQFFHPRGWNHRRNPKMQGLKNRWNWHDIGTYGAVCHPRGWNPRKPGSETREIEERDDGRGGSERERRSARGAQQSRVEIVDFSRLLQLPEQALRSWNETALYYSSGFLSWLLFPCILGWEFEAWNISSLRARARMFCACRSSNFMEE